MNEKSKKISVRKMTIIGVLGAISIILGMTPLGFIPIGPTKATIMHIPVLIGAITEGPVVGGAIGLIFGLFSTFQALTNPTPVSFVFLNPIVSILPRVLMGVMTHYIYVFIEDRSTRLIKFICNIGLLGIIIYLGNAIRLSVIMDEGIFNIILNLIFIVMVGLIIYYINKQNEEIIGITLASALGTMINTIGVMSLIYILYAERFVTALDKNAEIARNVIFGIGVTNGIPEVILAVIITVSVVKALKNNR